MDSSKEKIEAPPPDPPHMERDGYEIWTWRTGGIVPDVIIVEREGNERIKLWGFQGNEVFLVYVLHTNHYHPSDEGNDCEKWSKYDDSFPKLTEEHNPSDEIQRIAARVSDAPVIYALKDKE